MINLVKQKLDQLNKVESNSREYFLSLLVQITQFLDRTIIETGSNSEKRNEELLSKILTLKSFIDKNLNTVAVVNGQIEALNDLLLKIEEEETILEKLKIGEDPLKRDVGKRPHSINKVRNVKAQIVSNEDFDVEEE